MAGQLAGWCVSADRAVTVACVLDGGDAELWAGAAGVVPAEEDEAGFADCGNNEGVVEVNERVTMRVDPRRDWERMLDAAWASLRDNVRPL